MQSSNWIEFPPFSGWKFRKYLKTPPNLDFSSASVPCQEKRCFALRRLGRKFGPENHACIERRHMEDSIEDSPQNDLFFLSRSVITKQETCPVMTPLPPVKTTFGKLLSIWIQALFLNVPHRSSFSRYGAVVEMPSAHEVPDFDKSDDEVSEKLHGIGCMTHHPFCIHGTGIYPGSPRPNKEWSLGRFI